MQPLDTAADLALKRIMRGDATPWDSDQRSAWTRYILSLMFRNPAVVRALKDHMREAWDVGVKALEANYADRRRPTDPATFEEYFALTNGAAAQIGAANMIAEIIDNQRVGPTIFNMHWSRIELSRSSVTLLNSDRPIDRPLGLADSRAYIAFPIGPRTLFLASNDPTLTSRISRGDHTKSCQTDEQDRRVPGAGVRVGHGRFTIALCTEAAPERVILTAEQRQAALDAARGIPPTKEG